MFHSTHVFTGKTIYCRPAQSYTEFTDELNRLQTLQQTFAQSSITERTALLQQFADSLTQNQERLAEMVCEEVGRCLHECRAEISNPSSLSATTSALPPSCLPIKPSPPKPASAKSASSLLGIVLAVMPWNYPVWQILRFAIPALCAGNACAVKPAPSVARVSEALFSLIPEGLPLIGAWLSHEDTLKAIEDTDAMAFTGSTHTGRLLAAHAGKHLKKTVLELGGSNPFIILPDADLQRAAIDACYSRFRDAGQSCNAAKRIIVTQDIAEQFIPLFLAECAKLQTGNPKDPNTTLAPLHRQDLRQTVHEQVQDAVTHGAQCLSGGYIPEGESWFYPATVLDQVNPTCRVWHEEVFGPVAMILRADNPDHAVALANDTPFGLGACIYTADTANAWQYAEKIQAGSVFINRHTSSDLRLPFGGVKASGYGRELSEFGLYEFVNVKTYWQK